LHRFGAQTGFLAPLGLRSVPLLILVPISVRILPAFAFAFAFALAPVLVAVFRTDLSPAQEYRHCSTEQNAQCATA
jgi:hypothetical protein